MPKFTPGQWLDLVVCVAFLTYSAAVSLAPGLAPLAEAWMSPAAAASMAGAAFLRFGGSLRATAAAIVLFAVGLGGCAHQQQAIDAARCLALNPDVAPLLEPGRAKAMIAEAEQAARRVVLALQAGDDPSPADMRLLEDTARTLESAAGCLP